MFNDLSSLDSYLSSRRSGRPRNMIEPGPSDQQIQEIVATALRTPDHGKLAPWRVIRVDGDQRERLATELTGAYKKEKPEAGRLELEALETMARQAPALLVVLFSPVTSTKIPLWEQELSCGAFCMNIIHAIHAENFVGGWITGWPTYNDDVRDLFGKAPERIAGFIFAGTADGELAERPRPDLANILSKWKAE
ncbi:nitroreductase family protein [Parasphingorhabdus cellanae]|uniref:Putative NAD(P)H nitroreductase n=1 Tax=Parasphingorhabdus cellanae TaxID=2806553 RepID=A0ABX7T4V8_9SPHN|nr:nitroreductase [Parasphingorhabdus cellanae]QTD56629.1 nitroreductase [Parasphingorhabdus cellanae]